MAVVAHVLLNLASSFGPGGISLTASSLLLLNTIFLCYLLKMSKTTYEKENCSNTFIIIIIIVCKQ